MGVSPSLEIAKRALIAQRLGLDATSGNIANVNTPGYSRRVPELREGEPLPSSNGFVGTGVLVSKLRSFREEFFDKQIRRSFSHLATLETDNTMVQRLSMIFGEPGENSLNNIVSQFLNSFEDLSQNPTDLALRQRTVTLGQTLLTRFKEISKQFEDTRNQISSDVYSNIDGANKLIREIADLNFKIASSNSKLEGDKQSLIDQRATKIEELSKLIDINVTNGDFGTLNVFTNGINLVTGSNYLQLKAKESINSQTGERSITLYKIDAKGRELSTVNTQNGKIASLIKHFNITFDNLDSSGGFSPATSLETFFSTFVQKVNNFTNQGYGLTDTTPPPPARNFFAVGTSIDIANTEINPSIANDVRLLPISANPGEVGDSTIARQISGMSTDGNFLQSQTPNEYLTNLIARIGNYGDEISSFYSTSKTANEQLLSQRESLIGVNLDEEAINLVKFQKAFEAASRVVSTTNDLLATLINLGR
jgi:flagellar hook-associated protein 1 FlgK